MKDTGWTRSSTGRPPIEALRLLEEECPTWFESFRMRLMFIGAFVYIATVRVDVDQRRPTSTLGRSTRACAL